MLMVYLIALIVGGVLLAGTLIFGGDGDASIDDHGGGDGHGGDHASGFDALLGWFPLTSLRFWTFFGAFFGLVGTVLAAWKIAAPVPTAILAVAGGYLSGLMMDRAVRYLRRTDSDSSLGERDLVGCSGQVVVPLAADKTGKVRLHLKGRTVDLLAETEDEAALGVGQPVLVLSMRGDGHVVVTRESKEEGGA
jgi:membrane protein implicated in regulation of membrane protease activity